jgi:hypothetical protein
MLRPTIGAAVTASAVNKVAVDLPLTELVQELTLQVRECLNGNLERCETMLTAQAHSLDAIFNALTQRRTRNAEGGYPQAAEAPDPQLEAVAAVNRRKVEPR